jgi:hypothetical protein
MAEETPADGHLTVKRAIVVRVRSEFVVRSLKSIKNRTVVVPAFVTTALAATAAGKVARTCSEPHRTAATSVPRPGMLARRRGGTLPGGR